jgi:hypothetical protein
LVRVARSLVYCVVFVDHCLSFSFGHCIVCPSIYAFWLPLWYLQIFLISDTWALDQHPSAFYLIKSPITLDYKVFITCILLSYCSVVSLVTFDTIDKEGTSKIIWYILIFKRKWLNENPRVTEVFAVVYMF